MRSRRWRRMRRSNAADDRRKAEEIEERNDADQMVYSIEKL